MEPLDAYLELLSAAARELRGRGIEQWDPDATEETRAEVEALLAEGNLVAREDGALVGACVLTRRIPAVWTTRPAPAAYVHRLVVRADRRGRDLGGELLRDCASRARAWSCDRLRLDCWEGNARLRAFYEAHGFASLATVPEKGYFVRLLELRLV